MSDNMLHGSLHAAIVSLPPKFRYHVEPNLSLAQQRIGPGLSRLLTLKSEFGLARFVVELRGDQHHCDQDDTSGDEVGKTISRSKRAVCLLGAGSGYSGQEGESDRRADLLAGCEQATGQTLLAAIYARRRTDRGGRQGQSYSQGGQQQSGQHVDDVAAPTCHKGEPHLTNAHRGQSYEQHALDAQAIEQASCSEGRGQD